jgi:presenilin-like A22 family membrane protease
MKHNIKISLILLGLFFITQFIGLFIISSQPFNVEVEVNGTIETKANPYLNWINPSEKQEQNTSQILSSIIIAFIFAVLIFMGLSKLNVSFVLKGWFFLVVCIALFISIFSLIKTGLSIELKTIAILSASFAIILGYIKVFTRNIIVHNFTELLIYPGIATIFVTFLNPISIIILLIIISVYDMWAVWHSGVMQKMAKYQIENLKIFSGFFIPYMTKEIKDKIKKIKKLPKSKQKDKKVKINVAMLGGGDIIFPLITAGIFYLNFGFLSSLFIILGAGLGLIYLFTFGDKKKFYPAMPYITTGIFLGMLISYLINFIF